MQRTTGDAETDLDYVMFPCALCNDSDIQDGAVVGDPTEGALYVLAQKGGVDVEAFRENHPRIASVPFDSDYKFMATFHTMPGADGGPVVRAYVKGAPDVILGPVDVRAGCRAARPSALTDEMRAKVLAENDRIAGQGKRVLAFAQREFDPATFDPSADLMALMQDLELAALVGEVDPPRAEAKKAIAEAKRAGIRVRMITGDHAVTAEAIAHELGIEGRAVTGAEFAALSDEEADEQVDDIGVIARVAPEHKVRLVEVLKRKRPRRRDDRRRGQRRTGHRRGRHRHRHGDHGHGRRQGRRQDDPGRRQLRHHRRRGRRGPRRSTTTCRSSCASRSPTSSCSSWRSWARRRSRSRARRCSSRRRCCGSTWPSSLPSAR